MLREARNLVIFTGAGMSAESGVPTFRDALTGLWEQYDAEELATPEAFQADPALVWGWYEWRRARVSSVLPNGGHIAVAMIESRIPGSVLITQNVDDLHEQAGSSAPIHLHGSLFAPRCSQCSRPATLPDIAGGEPVAGRRVEPPRCHECGSGVRPGIVWFGEPLPETALAEAMRAASSCDLLLAIGTSGVVYPAAEIPSVAARNGATVIQINPHETPFDRIAGVNLRGPAAQILPELVETAWAATP